MRRLVILSGPSCVGKTPLFNALKTFAPHEAGQLEKLVLYHSRAPRPGEQDGVDYHFRDEKTIQRLGRRRDFFLFSHQGEWQGLDLLEAREKLTRGSHDLFLDANPYFARGLAGRIKVLKIPTLAIYLSPLSAEEITAFKAASPGGDLRAFIAEIMRRKLASRTQKQRGPLTLPDLQMIERRVTFALDTMQTAHQFDWVLPNHDGEDSSHWTGYGLPLGDARKTLLAFIALLQGKTTPLAERWKKGDPV